MTELPQRLTDVPSASPPWPYSAGDRPTLLLTGGTASLAGR